MQGAILIYCLGLFPDLVHDIFKPRVADRVMADDLPVIQDAKCPEGAGCVLDGLRTLQFYQPGVQAVFFGGLHDGRDIFFRIGALGGTQDGKALCVSFPVLRHGFSEVRVFCSGIEFVDQQFEVRFCQIYRYESFFGLR